MTVVSTAKISGTDITVGRIGHGLMMMTLRDPAHPFPEEEALESIKAGVEAMPAGVKMLLNSGEFYGLPAGTANLELLSRFYAKYPEYAEKTFLTVKGGMKPYTYVSDGSPENLRRSIENINAKLGGIKKMDLFECARVPENVSLEDLIRTLCELKSEGHFSHIGMSECSAATLRRAHALHPIAFVEIEVSLWSYEEETKKVIATAQELGISVAAYSPLVYTTSLKDLSDVVLTEDELAAIDDVLATHSIKGGRSNDKMEPKILRLWA